MKIDMLLFYPAGKVMDRLGRLWVAIPSMVVMGVATLVLPLTSTLVGVSVVAMVLGFGNGIGSGILMTLGADTAPAGQRARYLGIWRFFADTGGAAGPLVVSAGAGSPGRAVPGPVRRGAGDRGDEQASRAYWVGVVTSLAAAVVVLVVRDPAKGHGQVDRGAGPSEGMRAVLGQHWRVFATLEIAVLGVSAVGGARNTVLPVWTESLGFDPSATSLAFGISGAIDMLLFYPGGQGDGPVRAVVGGDP